MKKLLHKYCIKFSSGFEGDLFVVGVFRIHYNSKTCVLEATQILIMLMCSCCGNNFLIL